MYQTELEMQLWDHRGEIKAEFIGLIDISMGVITGSQEIDAVK